ncbi:MAG: MCE family protein [Calditrichaeota bacterium]|nr:MAG: MCE family protein [Calditrichota bacterium]
MATKSQKIRLGIFVSVTSAIGIIILIALTGQKIFEQRDTYFVKYSNISVQGLEVGSQVKFNGISVGRVESIEIDKTDVGAIVMELSLEEGIPIKKDTKATLVSLGITGLKIIELQGGTNETELLEIGGFIEPGQSLFDEISGKAEVITEKIETVLNNFVQMTGEGNRENIATLIEQSASAMSNLNNLISTNQIMVENSLENMNELSTNLNQTAISLDQTIQSLNRILISENLNNTFANLDTISSNIKEVRFAELSEEMQNTLVQMNKTMKTINSTVQKSQADIIESTESLRRSLQNFDEFTRIIKENPSAIIRGVSSGDVFEN